MNLDQFKLIHVSCWQCGSILVSCTRSDWVTGSSPFALTNILLPEFSRIQGNHLGKTQLPISIISV